MSMPTVRLRVDFGRDAAVGPGKIALLEHIGSGGSLSQAARELRMSYRRAWQLLESLNGSFRKRAVLTVRGGRGGGGARVTPFGEQLIHAYRELEAGLERRAARSFRPILPFALRNAGVGASRAGRAGARGTPVLRLSRR